MDEVLRIDDRDERVEPGQARKTRALFIGEGEGLGHRQRLGDAGALHEQIVEAALPGEVRHLLEEILPERAADTAVGELHQFLFGAGEPRCGRTPRAAGDQLGVDQLGVDVDLAHVVDDDRHPAALAVGKDMVQERGLAGPQKARQNRHGQAAVDGAGGLQGGLFGHSGSHEKGRHWTQCYRNCKSIASRGMDRNLNPTAHALRKESKARVDIVEFLARNPDADVVAIRDLCRSWRLRGLDPLIEEAMGEP